MKYINFLALTASILVTFYAISSTWWVAHHLAPDFSIFYHAALDIKQGILPYTDHHLYTAFNYPMPTLLFFLPFALLPYQLAEEVFIVLTFFSVYASVAFSFMLLNKRIYWENILIATALAFWAFPTKFTLGMGQTNLIAYALLLAGFLTLTKKQQVFSVLLITIAIYLKPALGLSLIVLLLEKRWKIFFAISFLGAAIFILVPLLFHQPRAPQQFLSFLLQQNTIAGRGVYYNQGLLGFLSRTPLMPKFISIFYIFLTTLFAGIIILIAKKSKNITEKLSLIFILLVIVDPLSWQHHFVFLTLPFMFLFFTVTQGNSQQKHLLIMLVVSYMLIAGNIKDPEQFLHFPAQLALSNQFYSAILLFCTEALLVYNRTHAATQTNYLYPKRFTRKAKRIPEFLAKKARGS